MGMNPARAHMQAQSGACINPHNNITAISNNSSRTQTITDEEKQSWPYYYYGYPAFSQWMASSNDCFILRRFSKVNARCLLHLQHQIAKKERELDDLDAQSQQVLPRDGGNGCDSFDEDMFPRRNELLVELRPLLREYNDLVNSFAEIRAKPTSKSHHMRNLTNYFVSYPDAIVESERHFEGHEGDLFPIVARVKTPLRIILEKWQKLRLLFAFFVGDRDDRVKSSTITYHSDTAFDNFVCAVIIIVGLGLLLSTMWWLKAVEDRDNMLGIITGSIVLFTAWLWTAAGPRPFEILLGSAAYSAVLYVYLQIAGQE